MYCCCTTSALIPRYRSYIGHEEGVTVIAESVITAPNAGLQFVLTSQGGTSSQLMLDPWSPQTENVKTIPSYKSKKTSLHAASQRTQSQELP